MALLRFGLLKWMKMEVGEVHVFNVRGNNLSSSAQFEVWCMPTHV